MRLITDFFFFLTKISKISLLNRRKFYVLVGGVCHNLEFTGAGSG